VWGTLIGIEDAIQRGLGIQKYWQVYLLMVITEDIEIETRFIISDRGLEWIEKKAASEHPSSRVVVQWVGEIQHEYDIFGFGA